VITSRVRIATSKTVTYKGTVKSTLAARPYMSLTDTETDFTECCCCEKYPELARDESGHICMKGKDLPEKMGCLREILGVNNKMPLRAKGELATDKLSRSI